MLRSALQLAEEFEVGTVVTMSGLPAAPGDSFPAWRITTVWPPENLRLLEHQWTVAVDYWGELVTEARRRGVRVAIEMHANQVVYNVPGLLRLETIPNERTGERAWNDVAVGTGHPDGDAFWSRFIDALRTAGYDDGPLSIENEDYTLGQREAVSMAVDPLRRTLSTAGTGR